MNATQRVAMRLDERRRPVERVVEVLRADERVAAAALTSSYARGETDGLSDLDLLVGVLDAHAGESVPARRREVDRIAAVVWCFITVAGHPVDAVGQEDRRARPGPLKGAEQALPVGDLEDRSPGRRPWRATRGWRPRPAAPSGGCTRSWSRGGETPGPGVRAGRSRARGRPPRMARDGRST